MFVFCLLILSSLLSVAKVVMAEESSSALLTFDRQRINRYSLDHLPRSLSVRQGPDRWLGYDLEKGKLYKAWRAPANDSGLAAKGFTTQSQGVSWYEDKTEASWEMRYAERRFLLNEHIPKEASSQGRMERRLYVDRLEPGEAIIPPEVLRNPWSLFDERGEQTTRIFGSQHYRWVLP